MYIDILQHATKTLKSQILTYVGSFIIFLLFLSFQFVMRQIAKICEVALDHKNHPTGPEVDQINKQLASILLTVKDITTDLETLTLIDENRIMTTTHLHKNTQTVDICSHGLTCSNQDPDHWMKMKHLETSITAVKVKTIQMCQICETQGHTAKVLYLYIYISILYLCKYKNCPERCQICGGFGHSAKQCPRVLAQAEEDKRKLEEERKKRLEAEQQTKKAQIEEEERNRRWKEEKERLEHARRELAEKRRKEKAKRQKEERERKQKEEHERKQKEEHERKQKEERERKQKKEHERKQKERERKQKEERERKKQREEDRQKALKAEAHRRQQAPPRPSIPPPHLRHTDLAPRRPSIPPPHLRHTESLPRRPSIPPPLYRQKLRPVASSGARDLNKTFSKPHTRDQLIRAQSLVRSWLVQRRFRRLVQEYGKSKVESALMQKKRNFALEEILETERRYVKDMKTLNQFYVMPLRMLAAQSPQNTAETTQSGVLGTWGGTFASYLPGGTSAVSMGPEDIGAIFSCLDVIIPFNQQILEELEHRYGKVSVYMFERVCVLIRNS